MTVPRLLPLRLLASPTHSRSNPPTQSRSLSSVPVSLRLRLTGSHQPSPARRTVMQVGGGGGGGGGDSADLRGRHRIQAELKKLEQEARFLEVSALCLHSSSTRFLTSCLVRFRSVRTYYAGCGCWPALLCSKKKVLLIITKRITPFQRTSFCAYHHGTTCEKN